MNLYFKICTALLFVFSTSLFSESLVLEKDSSDETTFSCIILETDIFLIGDLVDVYSESVEINGRILYRNFIDTLVVTEVTALEIILEPLWDGAAKNLESGYFLSKVERNIETDTPLINSINEIVQEKAGKSKVTSTGIYIGVDGGIDYSIYGQIGASMGVSINFGNSSIGLGSHASINDFSFILLDLTYTYNFPIHKNFALFAGAGSAVVLEFLTDYNLNILNGVGITVDGGIKWVTGINLNISIMASYYGLYNFPSDTFTNTVFFGTSIAYNTRRLF